MRKTAFILLLTLSTVFIPSFVQAEDSTVSTSNTIRTTVKEDRAKLQEAYRARVVKAQEELKAKRMEIQENIKKVRDESKRKIVENTSSRLNERNAHWVSHWNNVLDRLTKIVDKLETRVNEEAAKGKDVSAVKAAISTAQSQIASAQTKVNTQAGNVYTITITSEDKIREAVTAQINKFQADVKNVVSSIEAARRAVSAIFPLVKVVADRS